MSLATFYIYRAEALTISLNAGERQQPRTTVRLPANVPYFVDNLWEFLRPIVMPSRRHAIYASPTPELARKNRSGCDQGLGYCVYRLVVDGAVCLAQLKVTDARDHADVNAMRRLVQSFAEDLVNASSQEKPLAALLFLPSASPADWEHARKGSAIAAQLIDKATALSTFWHDASASVDNDSDGELFLNMPPGSGYLPIDLERYPLK